MAEFFVENMGTIIVALVIAGVVTAITIHLRRNAKKGRCAGCGDSCGGCSH